jgi:hypothetical protein
MLRTRAELAQPPSRHPMHTELLRDGFARVPGARMREWLESHGNLHDWPAFAASWNQLGPDPYLAALGRQRRRRYAVFTLDAAVIRLEPAQPHYQSVEYNALQGGIARWFEPLLPTVAASASLLCILRSAHALFVPLSPAVRQWRAEVHQFRIEARADAVGEPTPEGSHRDGVDWVLVLLVERRNVHHGSTTILAPDGRLLGEFTLSAPMDAALVDDARVLHGVTPVQPIDPTLPAWRDVLVVTLRAARPGAPEPSR